MRIDKHDVFGAISQGGIIAGKDEKQWLGELTTDMFSNMLDEPRLMRCLLIIMLAGDSVELKEIAEAQIDAFVFDTNKELDQ